MDVADAFAHPIPFAKMHGSGNDFVMIDNRTGLVPSEFASAFAQVICRRGVGIGCDGVVLIDTDRLAHGVAVRWRYLNADGSDGDLCGNGAMCGARFAVDCGIASGEFVMETPAGLISANVMDDGRRITVRVVDAELTHTDVNVDEGIPMDRLMVGVPHLVGIVDDADAIDDLHSIGQRVRHHAGAGPTGANVNIIHRIDGHTIRMRTYERGVEAETLACGTGSVASAVTAARKGLVERPVTVITSSGLPLIVDWTDTVSGATDVFLTGQARYVARGDLDPELFQPLTGSSGPDGA